MIFLDNLARVQQRPGDGGVAQFEDCDQWPLENLPRVKHGKALATDGPFVEAKDLIGGYFMIDAVDYAEAEKIAETCPHLTGNQWIEIRRIEEMG